MTTDYRLHRLHVRLTEAREKLDALAEICPRVAMPALDDLRKSLVGMGHDLSELGGCIVPAETQPIDEPDRLENGGVFQQ